MIDFFIFSSRSTKFIILLSLLIFSQFIVAQKNVGRKLEVKFDRDLKWLKRIDYKENLKDSSELDGELSAVLANLYKKSHLAASVDSVVKKNTSYTAYFHVGEKLHWAKLHPGNVEEEVLSKTGYRDKIYNQYRFRDRQYGRFTENLIIYYENNGYPFVTLKLDSIVYISNKGIEAKLNLDKKKYVVIDTIEVHGGDNVADKYLYNYLNIKPGKPYNESNIRSISSRIQDLSFVGESAPPNVIFTETRTGLQLFLVKKRASRFDGIIGLLQDEGTGKVVFTGDVKLSLTNIFRRGELIALNWRGLPNQTQDLNIKFNYPYILNSMFGVDVEFKLYKRDTTFLDVITNLGLQYFINSRDYLKVIYTNHRSNLISTSQYEGKSVLPPVLDFTTNMYGLEIFLNKVDYIMNPKKGFKLTLNGKAGFKNIRKNINLEDSLYNSVELQNVIYRGYGYFGYFLPVFARHILHIANQTAFIRNAQILENELYRIGGLKTLRGFNEETIPVSMYSITTIEYRFILDKNSYLNAFADLAYIESTVYDQPALYDRPYGFGVGTAFETGAGIFSLSYAVGSQQGNPIDLRSAKVHFGFLNFF